jgi:hypothetical protein
MFGDVGAYIGPVVKLSDVNRAPAFLMGARAGMTMAAAEEAGLRVGVGMYGTMNCGRLDSRDYLRFAYGGLDLEYVWHPDAVLHVSAMTLIGAGTTDADTEDRARLSHMWTNGPALFVVEPGIGLTLNVAPLLRLGGAVTYRAVSGPTVASLRGASLNSWSGQLEVTLGRH